MVAIVFPVALFIFVAAILNGKLFLNRKYSYSEKAYLFIPLLFGSSALLLVLYDVELAAPSPLVWWLLLSVVGVYLGFSYLWWRTLRNEHIYGINTIPAENRSIVTIDPVADLTKLFEILFQDVVVFAIVLSLTSFFANIYTPLILFTLIVSVVHLPGVALFGRIFGTYWLVCSTILAPLAFYFVSIEFGLYYLFILHTSITLLLYVVIYILSKTKNKQRGVN